MKPPAGASWLFVLVGMCCLGCGPSAPVTEWLVPGVDARDVIDYEFADYAARQSHRIELLVELVIGQDELNDEGIFKSNALAVSDSLDVFIKDTIQKRILVYDGSGAYKLTIGRQGEGPGELSSPGEVFIVDDVLTVADLGRGRFARWTLGGERREEIPANVAGLGGLLPLRDGTVLDSSRQVGTAGLVARFRGISLSGSEVINYPELPGVDVSAVVDGRRIPIALESAPEARSATDRRTGTVYLGHASAYQVAAFSLDGTPSWGVRVAAPRYPLPRGEIRSALERTASMSAMFGGGQQITASDVTWPDYAGAIRALRVDGRGRLYVFPHIPGGTDRDAAVDVFSSEGELLFSGIMPFFHWGDVVDDYIYTWDPIDHESMQTVVRYRIEAPFVKME